MDLKRRKNPLPTEWKKPSPLPIDYLKMVTELYTTHYHAGLKALSKFKKGLFFETSGNVYPDEVLLCLSLLNKKELSALTVSASCDFDPAASAPTLEDLLATCVDAIGAQLDALLDPAKPKQLECLVHASLGSLKNLFLNQIPLDWTPLEINRQKIFLKVDASNPYLDRLTEEWLDLHDPNAIENKQKEEEEVKKLFIGSPKKESKKREDSSD